MLKIKNFFLLINKKVKTNKQLFRQIELLALVSSVVMIFTNRAYFISIPANTSIYEWVVFYFLMISNIVLLNFILAVGVFIFVFVIRKKWMITIVAPFVFFLFNIFIYLDSLIYQLYRFHFNSMVWNMINTKGIHDSVSLGFQTSIYIIAVMIFILCIIYVLFYAALLKLNWHSIKKQTILIINICVFLIILSSKFLYAYGDFTSYTMITRAHNIVPFYIPLTMKEFFMKNFGMKPKVSNRISLKQDSSLNYPRNQITYKNKINKTNIIMIMIESGRFDMLKPEIMPNLYAWGKNHIVAENHYSGGNASRFGLFSALYGIHATYWHSFLSEKRSSVLMDELEKMNYRFGIFSSTDLHFPEMRLTAFKQLNQYIKDNFKGDKIARDQQITDETIKIINEKNEQPYFAFVFYDASHQPYVYPESHNIFKTDLKPSDINYATLATSKKQKWTEMRNRYKNSLHFIDEQLGRIFEELEKNNHLQNTLVLIAGDHGEAFGELNGRLGHNNSFSRFQTKTIMAMHIPGTKPQVLKHNTSHYDFLPTIFNHIGAQNNVADYSHGQLLLNPALRDYLIISTWDTAAMLFSDGIIEFGHYNGKSGMKAYTHDLKNIKNTDAFFDKHVDQVTHYIQNAGKFYK